MSWVKLDDSMTDDGKIANLSDSAFRAYISAICYSGRMLTDGRIPKGIANRFMGRRASQTLTELLPMLWHERDDLCSSEHCEGLCELPADEYLIHNYLKYNPTREQVLAKRAQDLRRKGIGVQ